MDRREFLFGSAALLVATTAVASSLRAIPTYAGRCLRPMTL